MKDTEKRIQAYKEMLPRMRERVIAAVSLLAVAACTMVSATYAWLVLSRSPEVMGLQTNISANGNLEIALATGSTIAVPANTQIGDGSKDLVDRNITWGNLINLSDPAYGLEHIVLRPASLNTNSLIDSPLYAAKYSEDGRVETLNSDFAYAYWDVDTFNANPLEPRYGVRAIASVTFGQAPGQNLALADAVKKAETSINTAADNLKTLAQDDAMQDLVGLMGSYIQAQIDEKLGGEEPLVYISVDQMDAIYYLVGLLKECMEDSAVALADVYNVEMLRRSDQAYMAANKFTGEYLLTATQAEIQAKLTEENNLGEALVQPSMLSYLWQLRTDYDQIVADMAILETYVGRDDVVYRNLRGSNYPAIETYVNHLVDTNTTTVNGIAIGKLSMDNIGGLTGGSAKPIVIHKGIIQRMDKFTGAQIQTQTLSVSIKVFGFTNVARGQATTSATAPFVLPTEFDNALEGETSHKGTNPVAADTFGLALDFWVRTNAADSKLTLYGNPIYETQQQEVVVQIASKNYTLYTVTGTVDGQELSATAYEKDGTYYHYDLDTATAGEALGTASDFTSIEPLTQEVTVIVGYQGGNRVWNEDSSPLLDENSNTMGAGSCYVFYPKTPEDQTKTLQLLQNLKIAFIDQYGTLLGEAVMDTEHAVAQSGKVTVPVVCAITNHSMEDLDGNPLYYITDLEANTPTFITALLYLDGQKLGNDQVLAASDIQGSLNLQFTSTADLVAMNDPVLMAEKCTVTAQMEEPYTVAMDATEAERTKEITVAVSGYEPQSVVAYFQREISSTQGIRQGRIDFIPNGDGTWTQSYTFTTSGRYVLREIILDGVTYELDQNPLVFTVEGFTISDVYCEHNGNTYMLTDRHFETEVSLSFSSDDANKMPASVKGAFIHTETGNRTTVHFTRSTGAIWRGSATFTTSGEYRMEYLELDEEYTGLPVEDHISFNLYLGLTASVYAGDTNFALENGQARDVPISLIIRADSGDAIEGLSNVWLQYSNNGSGNQEIGVGAGMVWNADRHMYEGTFHLEKAGIYNYHYVSIKLGESLNYLNTAAVAPTLTAISTTVPSYVSRTGFGDSFSLGNDAAFTIRFRNADAATVDVKLTNQDGEVFYVRGVIADYGTEQDFTFTIPVVDGKQDGTWTVEALYMTNVYGGANNTLFDASIANGPDSATDSQPLYTVPEGYYDRWWTWSVSDITNEGDPAPVVTVGSTFSVAFTDAAANADQSFGKDGTGAVTGLFGANYSLSNLELQILADGNPLSDYGMSVSSVRLEYRYDTASFQKVDSYTSRNTYGDYTVATGDVSALVAGDRGTIVYTLGSNSGALYQLTTTNTGLSVAGRYQPYAMTVTVTGSTGDTKEITVTSDVLLDAPRYEVWSCRPTVEVSGVSSSHSSIRIYKVASPANAGGDMFQNGKNLTWADWNKKNSSDTATVYMYVQAKSGTFDQEPATMYQSKVSLKLSNISTNFTDATMTFAHNVASVGDFSAVYTFTPTGLTQSAGIGGYKQGSAGLMGVYTYPTLYPMGSKTVEQVIIEQNGVLITMQVNPITINNPLAPTTVDYVVNGDGTGFTVPGAVYPADGTTVVLPGTQTWTSDGKRNEVSGGYTKAEGSKTYNGYKYSRTETSTGCTGSTTTTEYYYQWTMVETKYESVGTIYSWTNTHTIVGWLVNGVQYDPGETVYVDGDVTITAVIETTKGAETAVQDVAVYYNWDYTQGNEVTSGNKVGDDWTNHDTTDVLDDETNTIPFGDAW